MKIRSLLPAFALVLAPLAACGDDDNNDPANDVGQDVTEDTGSDTGAGDTGTGDVEDDAGDTDGDTDVDVVEPEGNPPTEPLSCSGEQVATISPTTAATLELPVTNTTTTGVRLNFLGREVSEPTEVVLNCVDDMDLPEGFTALAPAFHVTADTTHRFGRRYFVTMPFEPFSMPEGGRRSAITVFWDGGQGVRQPIITNFHQDVANGSLRFETELTGTFQVAIDNTSGTPRDREWQFRAITGVSMGGLGSSMIGARHPELFDIVAPLGGPIEWVYLSHYIHGGGMGGFALAPDFDEPVPYEARQEFEHPMSFDNWYFPTGEGTGGTFERNDYSEIFIDLSLAVGNIVTYNPESPFRVPGLPIEETYRTWAERCMRGNTCPPEDAGSTFTIPSGYYDDEYNPDGSLPVIAFCDGMGSRDMDIPFDRACDINFDGVPDSPNRGLYDNPCQQHRPIDITFAVDVNGNGIRDPGEPVIRNSWEPYRDYGSDGIPSHLEEGYHPVTNPDPAGDDYDYVSNPFGTEGNMLWDEGEPYDDYGLDGLPGTPQFADGGYDFGEGNGVFDYNPNLTRIFEELSPRHLIANMTAEQRRNTNWYMDAGIRDLFNFAVGANQLAGTIQGLGGNIRVYEDFFRVQGLPEGSNENHYNFAKVDYPELGQNVYVRYGNIDASAEDICYGDGKHVGTNAQIANRLLTMLGFVTNRFPDGDRTPVTGRYPLIAGTYFAPIGDDGRLFRYSIAFPPGYELTQCNDGRDNDGDGFRDGLDSNCIHGDMLSEAGESVTQCSDGIDNDLDGLIDMEDPDCHEGDRTSEWNYTSALRGMRFPVVYLLHGYGMDPEDLQITALPFSAFMAGGTWPKVITVFPDGYCGEILYTQCNDRIDNDGDGLIDMEDPGCAESGGRSESGEFLRYCEDGVDNDGDGMVDMDDGGCLHPQWDSEADCLKGTFYTNHVSYPDGAPGGPQFEDAMLRLIEHIDESYRVRSPEVFPEY